jgi:hypothetical protein
MNTTARPRVPRGPLRERRTTPRVAALGCAALLSGAAVLLAGCSASAASSASGAAAAGLAHSAPNAVNAGVPAPGSGVPGSPATPQAARLALATQSIIYTASLTIQAGNVTAAASRATAIVTAVGGYVSSEHASVSPAGHGRSSVSLQLKIPVARYQQTLSELSAMPGTRQMALTQQAQDVTQQVADVSSLVGSAQAAITQLQALLKRAGTVADLLSVQDQINTQESSLEALLAQQRALARETSYATVSITLVAAHPKPARRAARQKQHGFVAGLAAGWRGLRLVVSALLTALGAALPFVVLAAALAAAGYAGRRRLRRLVRRGSRPTAAG